MKKLTLIMLACVTILGACKKDGCDRHERPDSDSTNQTGKIQQYFERSQTAMLEFVSTEAPANANPAAVARPVKVSGAGTVQYIPNACGTGTVRMMASGSGKSSLMGNISQSTTFCMDGATGTFLTAITGVETASNGDELNYTFTGAGIDAATGLIYQDYAFTGGTGRFSGATGNVRLVYSVNTPTQYAFTGTGTVKY